MISHNWCNGVTQMKWHDITHMLHYHVFHMCDITHISYNYMSQESTWKETCDGIVWLKCVYMVIHKYYRTNMSQDAPICTSHDGM